MRFYSRDGDVVAVVVDDILSQDEYRFFASYFPLVSNDTWLEASCVCLAFCSHLPAAWCLLPPHCQYLWSFRLRFLVGRWELLHFSCVSASRFARTLLRHVDGKKVITFDECRLLQLWAVIISSTLATATGTECVLFRLRFLARAHTRDRMYLCRRQTTICAALRANGAEEDKRKMKKKRLARMLLVAIASWSVVGFLVSKRQYMGNLFIALFPASTVSLTCSFNCRLHVFNVYVPSIIVWMMCACIEQVR